MALCSEIYKQQERFSVDQVFVALCGDDPTFQSVLANKANSRKVMTFREFSVVTSLLAFLRLCVLLFLCLIGLLGDALQPPVRRDL